MCTSIALQTDQFYFGRNMDLEHSFDESVVYTPQKYSLRFRKAGTVNKHYALMGMAHIAGDYPLYADAMNECGLCMAALNFPDFTQYSETEQDHMENISPFELIPWILGNCADLAEVRALLARTHLLAIPFSRDIPLTPLHWHIADKNGSLVVEATKNGLCVHENPVHILTNSPPFTFQMWNLSQYLNLTVEPPEGCFTKAGIHPFGRGMGSFGLPGDFSPASRFVKAAYLRLHSVSSEEEYADLSQFFHLLDAVAVVNGSILPDRGKHYCTIYSCCMDGEKGVYYYKTYGNSCLTAVHMDHENPDSSQLRTFPLTRKLQILQAN